MAGERFIKEIVNDIINTNVFAEASLSKIGTAACESEVMVEDKQVRQFERAPFRISELSKEVLTFKPEPLKLHGESECEVLETIGRILTY